MKKKVLLFNVFIFILTTVVGQIRIESNGRVTVGPNGMDNFDLDNVLTMSIQGRNDEELHPGSKLAFGDFGKRINGGWNVFVGEYGLTDSDIMWLHGKKGIRMTSENGSTVLLELGCDASSRCFVPGGLLTSRISVGSNDSFKSDVVPVRDALSRIRRLNSYSYRYTLSADYSQRFDAVDNTTEDTVSGNAYRCLSEKERQDSAWFARRDSLRSAGTNLYGFVTEDFERFFPELVETDANGNKYLDYLSMIPLIIAALNEQQRTIDDLSVRLQYCCSSTSDNNELDWYNTESDTEMEPRMANSPVTENRAVLYQNMPNPFSVETTINYFLPVDVNSATLYIFTNGGILIKTYPLGTRGNGSVIIDGSTLAAGMYLYSLVADGQIIDSKRMILTE